MFLHSLTYSARKGGGAYGTAAFSRGGWGRHLPPRGGPAGGAGGPSRSGGGLIPGLSPGREREAARLRHPPAPGERAAVTAQSTHCRAEAAGVLAGDGGGGDAELCLPAPAGPRDEPAAQGLAQERASGGAVSQRPGAGPGGAGGGAVSALPASGWDVSPGVGVGAEKGVSPAAGVLLREGGEGGGTGVCGLDVFGGGQARIKILRI